jgi:hypothetical protein
MIKAGKNPDENSKIFSWQSFRQHTQAADAIVK